MSHSGGEHMPFRSKLPRIVQGSGIRCTVWGTFTGILAFFESKTVDTTYAFASKSSENRALISSALSFLPASHAAEQKIKAQRRASHFPSSSSSSSSFGWGEGGGGLTWHLRRNYREGRGAAASSPDAKCHVGRVPACLTALSTQMVSLSSRRATAWPAPRVPRA